MDFAKDFWLFEMSFIIVLFKLITKVKFYKHCFIKDNLQKHFCIIWWRLVRQRNPSAKPYGFKNLYPRQNPQLWLNSWQSLETFTKIIFVTSICRLEVYNILEILGGS
jgi:hypothetical protein